MVWVRHGSSGHGVRDRRVGRGGVVAAVVANVGRVMVARGTVDMAYR